MNDFLVACPENFIENAYLFIYETFCRTHLRISLNTWADRPNTTLEEAEKWIVNLIRMQDCIQRLILS